MVLLREELGDVLRGARQKQGRTLRDVSSAAKVSLGYLSEVERGQKEASSELLSSICEALDLPMSSVLRSVSDRVAAAEAVVAHVASRPRVGAVSGPATLAQVVGQLQRTPVKTVIPAPIRRGIPVS